MVLESVLVSFFYTSGFLKVLGMDGEQVGGWEEGRG